MRTENRLVAFPPDRRGRTAPRQVNHLKTALVVALLGAALTSCAATPEVTPGQDRDAATAALQDAGFTDVDIQLSKSNNGFQATTDTRVSVSLPSTATVTDQEAVMRYLFDTAWSVNDRRPNSSIGVGFLDPLSSTNWYQVGVDAGLPLSDSNGGPASPRIEVEDATQTFGPWPGDAPTLPDGAITLP